MKARPLHLFEQKAFRKNMTTRFTSTDNIPLCRIVKIWFNTVNGQRQLDVCQSWHGAPYNTIVQLGACQSCIIDI